MMCVLPRTGSARVGKNDGPELREQAQRVSYHEEGRKWIIALTSDDGLVEPGTGTARCQPRRGQEGENKRSTAVALGLAEGKAMPSGSTPVNCDRCPTGQNMLTACTVRESAKCASCRSPACMSALYAGTRKYSRARESISFGMLAFCLPHDANVPPEQHACGMWS